GYDTCEAATASDAFWRVCDGTNGFAPRIDLVLTDLRLLTSSGLELVYALRAVVSGMALMLMTAFPTPELRTLSESMGLRGLAKPFAMSELRSSVAEVLSQAADAREAS